MNKDQQHVAYVISAIEGIADPTAVKHYAELTGPSIDHFGGHFIVSNTAPVIIEGETPARYMSIVEFPSIKAARNWYDSPEYAEARAITQDAFKGRLLQFVEGSNLAR